MALGGLALRSASTLIRILQFLASVLVLGIFSYFLASLAKHHLHIATYLRAVEGISGAAVLYTILAVVLTCFLGGITFFAFLAIVLDVCFIGGFVAVAILTRAGAHSCRGTVSTPLGTGNAASHQSDLTRGTNTIFKPSLGVACKLQKAVFAVAIAAAFLFLVSAILQLLLGRYHKKEKRYGPGPSNNYTSGSGRSKGIFGKRNKGTKQDTELGAVGARAVGAGAGAATDHYHRDKTNTVRPSGDTALTGSTAASPDARYLGTDATTQKHHGAHLGHDVGPAGVGGAGMGVEGYNHQNRATTGPSDYTTSGMNTLTGGNMAPPDTEYVGYEPPEHRHYGGFPHLESDHQHGHASAIGRSM